MNYEEMSDFEIEVEVTKVLFPFVLDDGYEFLGSRDGFLYTKEDRKEHKISGNRLICTIKNYCNSPSDAWPIILSSNIEVTPNFNGMWTASCIKIYTFEEEPIYDSELCHSDKNALRAAMICFLKMKESENG